MVPILSRGETWRSSSVLIMTTWTIFWASSSTLAKQEHLIVGELIRVKWGNKALSRVLVAPVLIAGLLSLTKWWVHSTNVCWIVGSWVWPLYSCLSYWHHYSLKFAWVSLGRGCRPHSHEGWVTLGIPWTQVSSWHFWTCRCTFQPPVQSLAWSIYQVGHGSFEQIFSWSEHDLFPHFLPLAHSWFSIMIEESFTFCFLWHFLAQFTMCPVILNSCGCRIPMKYF